MCFCTTIKQENQHLHCVQQPQLPHNVEPIFRNHYSGDGKQKSRVEQQLFFFLFKNGVPFFFLVSLLHYPISQTLHLLSSAFPPGMGVYCYASLTSERNMNKETNSILSSKQSTLHNV